ncbi:probable transporter Mch4p [Trichomonascus vanleenenianus]|uniref:putative transporter Mch4p n=1 Tax=Trichomonascus vanleenenianus TaxID=2268995 RepID=UPI003EC9B383
MGLDETEMDGSGGKAPVVELTQPADLTVNELGPASPVTSEIDADENFPEGGWGWVVLIGTFCILFASFGEVQAFGVYQLYYEDTMPTANKAIISLIGALQPCIIYVASVPAVAIVAQVGFRGAIVVGYLTCALSLMLTSLSSGTLWALILCHGLLFGVGGGIILLVASAVPPEWFKKRRAIASGITASGSSIGGILWPIITRRLFDKVGFAWATRIIGFMYLPLMVISLVTIKPRLNGYAMRTSIWPDFRVVKSKRFTLLSLGTAIGAIGYFPPIIFIATYAARMPQGALPVQLVQYILVLNNSCSLIGRTWGSWMADRFGRLNVLIISMFFTGASQFFFWLPAKSSGGLFITFCVVFGVACAPYTALVPAVIPQLFGLKLNQSRLGVNFLFNGVGSLLGPVVAGALLPKGNVPSTAGFSNLIIYSGAMAVAGSLILLAVKLIATRGKFLANI